MLKASKGLPSDDYMARLFALKTGRNATEDVTVSGVPCVLENSVGKPLINYRIYGNTVQNGTPTPETPVEVQSVGNLVYAVLKDSSGNILHDSNGNELHSDDMIGYEIPVVVKNADQESVRINILLNEPLCKIGNYADRIDFKEKCVVSGYRKIVFDGTENWGKYDAYLGNGVSIIIKDMKIGYYQQGFCTHSKIPRKSDLEKGDIGLGVENNSLYWFGILDILDLAAISKFKAFLAEEYAKGTPVTVYYPIANPITTPITLPEIPTFDGTTIVEVDTEILPSDMEITYKSRRKNND